MAEGYTDDGIQPDEMRFADLLTGMGIEPYVSGGKWRFEVTEEQMVALLRRVVTDHDAALAGAGRLLPEDTRTEWGIEAGQRVIRIDEETCGVAGFSVAVEAAREKGWPVRQRWVGPWVPVPPEPRDAYSAAAFDPEDLRSRRPCGECGPGYWIGEEGCRHGVPVQPPFGEGGSRTGNPNAAGDVVEEKPNG